jgi:hypothetical protein
LLGETLMRKVEIFKLKETGPDYILLHDAAKTVRVNFGDDETYKKEASAAFFRRFKDQLIALPVDGRPFIGLDFRTDGHSAQVHEFHFAISSVEILPE